MSTRDPQHYPRWRVYLLVDPTTPPTNHSLGTVFYVGLRDHLPEPADLRDAADPESLPKAEVPARERLQSLIDQGVRPVVEVITGAVRHGLESQSFVRATLDPPPLNVGPTSGIKRLPGDLIRAVSSAREVALPDEGAVLQPVLQLPAEQYWAMGEDELFRTYVETFTGRSRFQALDRGQEGPLPILLTTRDSTDHLVFPSGFVLGVWLISGFEPLNAERSQWRVILSDDHAHLAALRRRYLHQVISRYDRRALPLGGTS